MSASLLHEDESAGDLCSVGVETASSRRQKMSNVALFRPNSHGGR